LGGERVPKNHPRIRVCGELDELNSFIGLARWALSQERGLGRLGSRLAVIQKELLKMGADLAAPDKNGKRILSPASGWTKRLEREIDDYSAPLPRLRRFILPGGTQASALLHVVRSVCRRTERSLAEASREVTVHPEWPAYLNRLSDWLYTASRWVNGKLGYSEKNGGSFAGNLSRRRAS